MSGMRCNKIRKTIYQLGRVPQKYVFCQAGQGLLYDIHRLKNFEGSDREIYLTLWVLRSAVGKTHIFGKDL